MGPLQFKFPQKFHLGGPFYSLKEPSPRARGPTLIIQTFYQRTPPHPHWNSFHFPMETSLNVFLLLPLIFSSRIPIPFPIRGSENGMEERVSLDVMRKPLDEISLFYVMIPLYVNLQIRNFTCNSSSANLLQI